jgi:hypothetical protein
VGCGSGNALGLYLGGAWFESRPGRSLSWLRLLVGVLSSPGTCWDSTPMRPWLQPSKSFPIHQSFCHLMLCSLDSVICVQ